MGDNNSICIHNKMIDCSAKAGCERCGWNPKVKEQRVKKMKAQLNSPDFKLRAGDSRPKSA